MMGFGFSVGARLPGRLGRTGVISTPHGTIETPAFIAVGTKATVKAVLPESVRELGAQAVLANAYHLYLQPGGDVVEAAGGLGKFMNWPGPTFTDSGGFQVMSLGVGFKKVLAMNTDGLVDDDVIAAGKTRLASVDEDGVTFTSHLNGSRHRFTPESVMRLQSQLGADICFALDECTTLLNTRGYQEQSVRRTRAWAERCLTEHLRLTEQRDHRPYQALFAVVQGAQYEDLRRQACRDLRATTVGGRGFDSRGICWASRSRTTSSRPWRTGRTPSTASHHPGWPGMPPYTPAGDGSTSTPPPRVGRSSRSIPSATATPVRTTRRLTCTTCSRPRRCWPRRCARSTTSGSSSAWSTGFAPASRLASSTTSRPSSWAATTPGGFRPADVG
jgi:hypothetical protein